MILDTSAWIEFIRGTEKGIKIKKIISHRDIFTSMITLAELVNWCLRNNIRYEDYLDKIKHGSRILELDADIAILAGSISYERKKIIKNWGMVDSVILGTSIIHKLGILTTDNHFKDIQHATVV